LFVAYLQVILLSYLVGSIPSAIIVGKLWKGIDVREHGSGNIGATNVFRVLGAGPGIVVLLLDALKGGIGAYCGTIWLGPGWGAVLGGIVAIIGHNWPVWLKFKGGRGVATGLGVIATLVPQITLVVLLVFIGIVYVTRYVSLGSIVAAVLVPPLMLVFHEPLPYLVFGIVASFFVVIRHHANIQRLLNGTELKISWGKKSADDPQKR
jgi:acyl phosphate:glycerol-3-phosphate acyltransferase